MNTFDQYNTDSLIKQPLSDPEETEIKGEAPEIIPNAEFFEKFLAYCYDEVLNYDKDENLSKTSEHQGDREFREELATFMYRFHKLSVKPENIIIGANIQILIGNLLRLPSIRNPSGVKKDGSLLSYAKQLDAAIKPRVVIPEDSPEFIEQLISNSSIEIKKVPVDGLGIIPDALLTSGSTVFYTNTIESDDFEFEDPEERRQELLDWLNEAPYRYAVEYDTSTNTSLDSTLKGEDKNDKVIYLNSFSNLLCKGISTAWMVLPDKLLEEYKARYKKLLCSLSYLDQLALKKFLKKGYMDNHLESMQSISDDDIDETEEIANQEENLQ